MPPIRADGVAVYVYRTVRKRFEFLQLLRSPGDNAYQQSWQIVYGGVRPRRAGKTRGASLPKTETAVEAALRELKEETNLAPIRMFQVEFLETFYFRLRDYVLVMPVFGVEVAADAPITLNHEHTAYRWVKESQIERAFMWRTQREALSHVVDYLHHSSAAAAFLEIDLHEKKRKEF